MGLFGKKLVRVNRQLAAREKEQHYAQIRSYQGKIHQIGDKCASRISLLFKVSFEGNALRKGLSRKMNSSSSIKPLISVLRKLNIKLYLLSIHGHRFGGEENTDGTLDKVSCKLLYMVGEDSSPMYQMELRHKIDADLPKVVATFQKEYYQPMLEEKISNNDRKLFRDMCYRLVHVYYQKTTVEVQCSDEDLLKMKALVVSCNQFLKKQADPEVAEFVKQLGKIIPSLSGFNRKWQETCATFFAEREAKFQRNLQRLLDRMERQCAPFLKEIKELNEKVRKINEELG